MKVKLTKKDLKYQTVIGAFHGVEKLLDRLSPIGYNAGVYGWNWDCYAVGKYYVINGYRSFPKCDWYIDYDIAKKYTKNAPKSPKDAERTLLKIIEKSR